MKKHFFLEGPIQQGKSTLIRKLIQDHLELVGGFSSQRLLNDDGKTVGFRIVPAEEAMELTRKYSPSLTNVFLHFDGGKTKRTFEVFTDAAIRFLRESDGKKLILLDEIGGVELLLPEFREALYNILMKNVPCLGVLKLEQSIRHMCSNANISDDCVTYHLQLRDHLVNHYDADMIRFERNCSETVEKTMKEFLEQIL